MSGFCFKRLVTGLNKNLNQSNLRGIEKLGHNYAYIDVPNCNPQIRPESTPY